MIEFLQRETALSAAHVASSCVNGSAPTSRPTGPRAPGGRLPPAVEVQSRRDGRRVRAPGVDPALVVKSNEANALVLDEFADRIKKTDCADVASGVQMLFILPSRRRGTGLRRSPPSSSTASCLPCRARAT